jgi:hypothetical protein
MGFCSNLVVVGTVLEGTPATLLGMWAAGGNTLAVAGVVGNQIAKFFTPNDVSP